MMIRRYGIQKVRLHGPVISAKAEWRRKAIFCLRHMAYRLAVTPPVSGLKGGIS